MRGQAVIASVLAATVTASRWHPAYGVSPVQQVSTATSPSSTDLMRPTLVYELWQ
jgi:hypothetical protein